MKTFEPGWNNLEIPFWLLWDSWKFPRAAGPEIRARKQYVEQGFSRFPLFDGSGPELAHAFGDPLRPSKSGNFENPCFTYWFLASDCGPGDARAAREFSRIPKEPRGPKGTPLKISKTLPNAIYTFRATWKV